VSRASAQGITVTRNWTWRDALVQHLNMRSDVEVIGLDGCSVACVHPEKVQMVVDASPDPDQLTRGAALFKLLGDPTRVRLLYALLEAGELCVCDLAASTGTAETTVSQSLRMLRASGVVTGRRQGRLVYYRLADAHVRMLLDLTREHLGHQGTAAETAGRRLSR
jgi:ArsR family transcriptional regulator, lead/cadmium/zinc/bismuth-responsive transcriptional repressor